MTDHTDSAKLVSQLKEAVAARTMTSCPMGWNDRAQYLMHQAANLIERSAPASDEGELVRPIVIKSDDEKYQIALSKIIRLEDEIAALSRTHRDLAHEYAVVMELLWESNTMLRSAHEIAKRDGFSTNWGLWEKRLMVVLEKQHNFLHGRPESANLPGEKHE